MIKEEEISKIQESLDLLKVNQIDLKGFDKLNLLRCDNKSSTYLIKDKKTGQLYEASHLSIGYFNFLKAIKIYSEFHNPLIEKLTGCSLHNFEGSPDLIFITDHAQNMNLSRILNDIQQGIRIKPWNDTTKLTTIYGISASMKYLHTKNILHRNLKPENIFFDDFCHPFIGNLFSSQILNEQDDKKKEVVGTMMYLAPEIISKQEYSKASDVYAFAIVVYQIFEGKDFFEKFTDSNIAYNVGYKKFRPQFTNKTPKVYKDLIESCWNDDPSKRPTFEQIVNELENNKKFITNEVDEEIYQSYIKIIHESEQGIDITTKLDQIFHKFIFSYFEEEEEEEEECFDFTLKKYDFLSKIKKINLKMFEIISTIDRGSSSYIYLIKHKKTGKLYVAKKFIYNESDLFLQELKIISQLNHPLILKLIGYSLTGFDRKRSNIIVTEYISNGSLHQILEKERNFEEKVLNDTVRLIIIHGIALTMKYLHSLDIIHRDLKPGNILINDHLSPKLCDFSISKYLNEKDIYEDRIVGTPMYIAPETLEDKKYMKESDVYAFSMLVYEIYTGKIPYNNDSFYQIFYDVVIKKKRPRFTNKIPQVYKNLIESCWNDDPNRRPTFEQIVEKLENNKEFITNEVDEELYQLYIQIIHESEQEIDITTKLDQIFPKYQLNNIDHEESSDDSIFEDAKLANSIESKLSKLNIEQIDINDFKLIQELGSGSYGKVYLIQHKKNKQLYAAKQLNSDYSSKSTELDFFSELEILSKLKHPSILRLIGYSLIGFEQEPNKYIITEYISNGDLDKLISNAPIEQWDETMKLINIYGIASAMSYVHAQNISHLDLKPLNVLIDKYLFPIICDFGLSKKTENNNKIHDVDVRSIWYCSPEIITDNEATSKSDVFSFGMLLYEMLTSQSLYKDMDYNNIIHKISSSDKLIINNKSIQKIYKKLIRNCLNFEPDKRPTFDTIVNELRNNPDFSNLLTNDKNKKRYTAYIEIIDNEMNGIDSSKLLKLMFTIYNISEIFKGRYDLIYRDCSSNENYQKEEFEEVEEVHQDDISKTYSCIGKKSKKKFYATVSNFVFEISKKEDFLNEINQLVKIDHPAIQRIISFKLDKTNQQPKPVIINEYFPFKILIDIIEKERKGQHEPEWNSTKKLINIYGIASALLYLNSHKIQHSNPNPKQIYVDSNYHPKMTEIGFFTQPKNSNAASKFTSIVLDESLFYLPPENLTEENKNNIDEKSDVYSLSIIIYEILTNDIPYPKNMKKQIDLMKKGDHRPVFNKEIPKVYQELIESCLSNNRTDRPSLSEVVSKLENDPNFITNDVDKEEFDNYKNILLKYNQNPIKY